MAKTVSFIFSRNKKIGSKLISWSSKFIVTDLEKLPSHVAILVEDDQGNGLVYESVLESGVRIVPYKNWKVINEECYKIPAKRRYEDYEIHEILEDVWGKKYDWMGILYFAVRSIGFIVFSFAYPPNNKWSSSKKFFCCEFAGRLNGKNYSMTTPAKMCSDLRKD
jgi:hypothetical protein